MHKLSVFNTFRTKDQLTGEALRQRAIISILSLDSSPNEKTRTAISQKIAKKNGIAWKNIYSGIFRDFEEVLVPLKIAEESGRLPLKRGPKALQEKGIPHYQLTQVGHIIALSLKEVQNKELLAKKFFSKPDDDEEFYSEIQVIISVAPAMIFLLLEKYVKAFCFGKFDSLLPFTLSKLKKVTDVDIKIQKEALEGFSTLSNSEQKKMIGFLGSII